MTLAETISTHLPEFCEATRGNPRHADAIERFRAAVLRNRGYEVQEIPLVSWRAASPCFQAAIRTLKPEMYVDGPAPKRYRGWTVNVDKRGFIRLGKKRAGRLTTLYIGKVWDTGLADRKLAAVGWKEDAA